MAGVATGCDSFAGGGATGRGVLHPPSPRTANTVQTARPSADLNDRHDGPKIVRLIAIVAMRLDHLGEQGIGKAAAVCRQVPNQLRWIDIQRLQRDIRYRCQRFGQNPFGGTGQSFDRFESVRREVKTDSALVFVRTTFDQTTLIDQLFNEQAAGRLMNPQTVRQLCNANPWRALNLLQYPHLGTRLTAAFLDLFEVVAHAPVNHSELSENKQGKLRLGHQRGSHSFGTSSLFGDDNYIEDKYCLLTFFARLSIFSVHSLCA